MTDVSTCRGGSRAGNETEVDEGFVHYDRRAGLPGGAQHVAARVVVHQCAGGVVEVRGQECQARRGLAQRCLDLRDLPAAFGGHRHRHDA